MPNKLRVLVIHHDQQLRGLFRQLIEGLGHIPFEALEALVDLDIREGYDVILISQQLPGIEFVNEAKRLWPQTPIVVITSGAPDNKLREKGCLFSSPPQSLKDMHDLIKEVLPIKR